MARNLQSVFTDPQRGPTLILSVLYSMSLSAWNLPQGTPQQKAAGLAAARELLRYAPLFFAPARRPYSVTEKSWSQARAAIETTAHQTVALLGGASSNGTSGDHLKTFGGH